MLRNLSISYSCPKVACCDVGLDATDLVELHEPLPEPVHFVAIDCNTEAVSERAQVLAKWLLSNLWHVQLEPSTRLSMTELGALPIVSDLNSSLDKRRVVPGALR